MDPLQDGIQGDTLSPIADGPLESGSCRNALIFKEDTIRYLRFQAALMNEPGSSEVRVQALRRRQNRRKKANGRKDHEGCIL